MTDQPADKLPPHIKRQLDDAMLDLINDGMIEVAVVDGKPYLSITEAGQKEADRLRNEGF